ncbi:hypothetical protein H0H92_014131 [Tricholoma furcatifolium]|nr:hypothetical protein H0H92_014131 [Tricholoma furcatifolium]
MTTSQPDEATLTHPVQEMTASLESPKIPDEDRPQPSPLPEKTTPDHAMRIYTRPQILFLSKSPLIQLPPGMPELKEWFGSENEQNLSKKEAEPTTPVSGRERRFRRDVDDGGKMGNFKHQSSRASDRDREKDREIEKDRERDIRDRDGHERLRHLSDKYDRDRLVLPSRGKERDTAPHLNSSSNNRGIGQSQAVSSTIRRNETRDVIKKKAGEVSDDWRKGSESGRKDREERGKSRVRETSRSRRELSPRRDRERETERENEDDPRRWRDDGKRDERLAARRADNRHARDKDILDPSDRRWVAAEDRESRGKRANGRDRKSGSMADEAKDRDERRDREREREKEPAWMDTYVPSPASTGILGGKPGDGELDGIQAWKRDRKEKEMKGKVDASPVKDSTSSTRDVIPNEDGNGNPLDEIQLFRLLMKREEQKKKVEGSDANPQACTTGAEEQTTALRDGSPRPQNGLTSHESSFLNGTMRTTSTQSSPQPQPQPQSALHSLVAAKESTIVAGPETFAEPHTSSFAELTAHHSEISRDGIPQFNPPPGSRLLAFARNTSRSQNTISNPAPNDAPTNFTLQRQDLAQPIPSKFENSRGPLESIPFEDQNRSVQTIEDLNNLSISPDPSRRATTERHVFTPSAEQPQFIDSTLMDNGNGYSANKGSRFAKFFDAKGREGAPVIPKTPLGLMSSSPVPGNPRQEPGFGTNQGNGPDYRTMDDIYAMLSSSAQGSRGVPPPTNLVPLSSNGGFGLQSQNNLHLLQQQQQQQQQLHANRLEPLYESRLDDRNFVPDGMVPGLRTLPPRNRDNHSMYPDNIDDMPFHVQQRLPPHQQPHQQRGFEQLYSGVPSSMYSQQGGRNTGVPLQSNQYRGGPSPLSHQQSHISSAPPQRLPPGLANLGGRPPHEPSQLLGLPGMNPGVQGALQMNGSNPQLFNNFSPSGNLGYGSGPPVRGPHQLQGQGAHLPMTTGHPGSLDPRTAGQNQLMGIGGGGGGLRAGGGGYFQNQQASGVQIPPLLAMRQQQQQQLQHQPQQSLPHAIGQMLPPHMQHQHPVPNSSQPAHDLMSLLMGGGTHRE